MGRCSLAAVVLGISAALLCPGAQAQHVWHEYHGHQYALSLSQKPWLENEAEAVGAGGHLVTINGADENAWLASTFAGAYCHGYQGDIWGAAAQIGYYLSASSGRWEWVSGQSVTYTNVHSSFPYGGTHAYLHVAPHPWAGTWNANPQHTEPGCGNPTWGIIERETSGALYFDDFDGGSLAGVWSIVRQDSGRYSVSGGNLNVTATSGVLTGGANNASNVFLMQNPSPEAFIATMRVSAFSPVESDYAQIDIIACADDDNMVRCNYGHIAGRRNLELGEEINAAWRVSGLTPTDFGAGPFYLRLVKVGKKFTQFSSTDGVTFTQSNPTLVHVGAVPKIGLTVSDDPTGSSLARVDWFEIRSVPAAGIGNGATRHSIMGDATAAFRFTVWGRVAVDGDRLSLDDGGGAPVVLDAPGATALQAGDYVRATGTLDVSVDPPVISCNPENVTKL